MKISNFKRFEVNYAIRQVWKGKSKYEELTIFVIDQVTSKANPKELFMP